MGGPSVPRISSQPPPPLQPSLDPALIEARRRMQERARGATGLSGTTLTSASARATTMLPALIGSGQLTAPSSSTSTPLRRR